MSEQKKLNDQFVNEAVLVRAPLELCIRFSYLIDFSFFIQLANKKNIEIHHEKERLLSIFQKYKERGIQNLLFRSNDYEIFVKELRLSLELKLKDPAFQAKRKLMALNETFLQLRDHLIKFGFQKSGFALANDIANGAIKNLRSSKELAILFKRFKDENCDKFIENTFVGYILSMMISKFEWQTVNIKAKANQAAFLSDITLEDEDFIEINNFIANPNRNLELLSDKVKSHPAQIAKTLKSRGLISTETALMIEQHHERPDDTAFPKLVTPGQVGLLSALHIVARHFMELVVEYDYDESKKDIIVYKLQMLYENKNFLQAFRALVKCLRIDESVK